MLEELTCAASGLESSTTSLFVCLLTVICGGPFSASSNETAVKPVGILSPYKIKKKKPFNSYNCY